MDNLYTETMLVKLNKPELIEILRKNSFMVDESETKVNLISSILDNGITYQEKKDEKNELTSSHKSEELTEDPADEQICERLNKDEVLASSWYSHRRHFLELLLEDEKYYTHQDIKTIIDEFMSGKKVVD